MPNYLIDINLISAAPADYDKLYFELSRNAFRTAADAGKTTGSHFYTTRESIVDVMGDVSRSAQSTGKKFKFTVIREKKGIRWD